MKELTKRHILIGFIAASLLPALLLPQLPLLVSIKSVELYIAAMLGYSGVVLLLWMYILGAKGIMGHVFTDLAPVLRIHKWIGKYGVLAIFAHPLLITFSYGESLLFSFIPLTSTWTERHILLGQIAFWILLLTWILSALVRNKLSWRTWKYLHYLAYICVPFALLHAPGLGSQQRAHSLVNAYFMMLVAVYIIISAIRLVSLFNLDRARYTVVRHIQLSPIDYMMRLEPTGKYQLTPRLGQYVYVRLGFISEDHPFSVTQYDSASGAITVTYRLAGAYTRELAKVTVDSTVLLGGPYGHFLRDLGDKPVVFIAGGIGVTPFAGPILQESHQREQWLFAANRSPELAVLYKPLQAVLGKRAVVVYSRDDSPQGPNEETGYITADILRRYLNNPSEYTYYLCGPPEMMGSMYEMLASVGIPHSQIRSEEFGW